MLQKKRCIFFRTNYPFPVYNKTTRTIQMKVLRLKKVLELKEKFNIVMFLFEIKTFQFFFVIIILSIYVPLKDWVVLAYVS